MPIHVHHTAHDGTTRLAGRLDTLGEIGLQRFTYETAWLSGGFSLGEGLPLQPGPLSPPGGATEFGILADAGPDAWGRRVIARKTSPRPRTSTEFVMAAADQTRQGALRFSATPEGPMLSDGGPEPISSLNALYQEVWRFQHGGDGGSIARILRAGTSQGGFRPKAVVTDDAGCLWIAKFPAETDTYDVETCEAAALHVAREAGLTVPEFRLVRVDPDRAILLVKRFDRTVAGRLGYQSMRTAMRLGIDEAADYQMMASVASHLSGTHGRLTIVATAALNIVVNNIDDHSRNFGFLQTPTGAWEPSPVFDLVPYPYEADGTPLTAHGGRSVEEILDLDWGVPRTKVELLTRAIAASASRVYDIAAREYGFDPESAANSELVRSAVAPIPEGWSTLR